MRKKAIIFDLDNTIYPVRSIGDELFASLFKLIEETGKHDEDMEEIKKDVMRKPFQVVADKYNFGPELTQKGIDLLRKLTYNGSIKPFDDYREVKQLSADKFLVTTGFFNLQQSKIKGMGIEQDFKKVYIVDPDTSDKTKKDIFAEILKENGYDVAEVLVIGDDIDSEIKAAQDLGIDTVLYDKLNQNPGTSLRRITDFKELADLV